MAIKGTKVFQLKGAGAIDQRWKETSGIAESIKNFRIDPTGDGWLADRGIEPWRDFAGAGILLTETSPYLTAKFDSAFVWTKQSTGQVYHFFEQAGELYYLWGNNGSPVAAANYWRDKITIDTGRRIRKVGEAGTQYIPYGNRLLIINGFDKPIWFYGDDRIRDFSFTLPTPEMELFGIQVEYDGANAIRGANTHDPTFTNAIPGLGDDDTTDTSFFKYRMTFVTDTGSESPLGPPQSVSWTNQAGFTERHGVFINELPVGKRNGVVARRIYRTKNMRLPQNADARDELYYLVKQINDNSSTEYIDIIPDSALIEEAPSQTASSIISTSYAYGETWNNRLWLAGGTLKPTTIIYSDKGLPEQFGSFSYFDVGSTSGGHITQLYSYYNNLLVFRESSIDIIREANNITTISQLTPDIGTTASNTIALVPGIGVVFLNKDGLYAITGGLDGGSAITVRKISDTISKEIQTINVPALPSATAAYSKKEKEYWCHYPRKGDPIPSRGLVLHQYNGTFSFRGANDPTNEYLWYFPVITTDPTGNFILGTQPDWRLLGAPSDPNTVGAIGRLVGAQVWSGAPFWGQTLTVASITGEDQQSNLTGTKGALQENIWESNWINFGSGAIKHRVFQVEVEIVSYGDNRLFLDWGYDYDVTWNSASSQKMAKSELVYTTNEDPVFGPVDTAITKATFTIGDDSLRGGRIVTLRYDVRTGLVENFRFRLRQPNGLPFHVLGCTINYADESQSPLNQNIRLQKGQPY